MPKIARAMLINTTFVLEESMDSRFYISVHFIKMSI